MEFKSNCQSYLPNTLKKSLSIFCYKNLKVSWFEQISNTAILFCSRHNKTSF